MKSVRESLDVDDYISSSSNLEEAYHVTTAARKILSAAGMDLYKWVTNSPELQAKWEESSPGGWTSHPPATRVFTGGLPTSSAQKRRHDPAMEIQIDAVSETAP